MSVYKNNYQDNLVHGGENHRYRDSNPFRKDQTSFTECDFAHNAVSKGALLLGQVPGTPV